MHSTKIESRYSHEAPYLLRELFGGVGVGEERSRNGLVNVALHNACVDTDGHGFRKMKRQRQRW